MDYFKEETEHLQSCSIIASVCWPFR